jgi:hypothetical protein
MSNLELAMLHHRLDLLVCQDDEVDECCGCKNSNDCLELNQGIKELEKA